MIVDCHTHIFADDIAPKAMEALHAAYRAEPVALPTVAGVLAHMAQSGVDVSVICPVATKPSQVKPINDWLLSLHEPKLMPFGAMHPHCDDAAAELDRLERAGVKGLKLQPFFQQFLLDDPRLAGLLDLIADRFLVLMHAGDEIFPLPEIQPTPERLARLLDRFPKLRMIAAHAGGYKMWDEVEHELVGRDLLFDISYTTDKAPLDQLRRIVLNHGTDKILWGSDFPWQSQMMALEGLRALGLSPEQERAILGDNFVRETA
ncbi:MAG: amidohydrolase family protein [Armatimonadetes bacterium]|nr:amidohydrolase family protein [Armatimonadota bacterium]